MIFSLLICSGEKLKTSWKSQANALNLISEKCGHPGTSRDVQVPYSKNHSQFEDLIELVYNIDQSRNVKNWCLMAEHSILNGYC